MSDRKTDPAIEQIEAELRRARFEEGETEAFLSRRANTKIFEANMRAIKEKMAGKTTPEDQARLKFLGTIGGIFWVVCTLITIIGILTS